MQQKITWTKLLLIGIVSSCFSCGEETTEKLFYEKYIFINESNYDIDIQAMSMINNFIYNSIYHIAADSSFHQEHELTFGSKTGFIAYSDSIVLIFKNAITVHLSPSSESNLNILKQDNYRMTSTGNGSVTYSYTFTNEHIKDTIK